jgi:ribosomal protein S18 acetylase RimI-like enzyme
MHLAAQNDPPRVVIETSVEFEITRAAPADRDQVVRTVVAAFVADPAYRHFFPDDDTYDQYATAFTRYLFDKRVGLGTVWIAAGGAVAALWDPPHAPESARAPELPDDVLARIESYDATVHPLLPKEPHWYLGVLATHPDHAGRRWGRAVMGAGVTTAHTEGLPACLETTNPSNVDLYEKAGWQVVGQADNAGPTTWVMVNRAPEGPIRT